MKQPDYSLLERLLFRGFITLTTKVGDVPIIWKTMNPTEHDMVDTITSPYKGDEENVKRGACILAYSTFIVNGIPVLSDRDSFVLMLSKYYERINPLVMSKLLKGIQILNQRAYDSLKEVQAYTYGYESKQNWYSFKDVPLNSLSVTGVVGTESLGLNVHQKLWKHFHSVDDVHERYDRDWSLAKFQASVHNYKGIKKIDDSDKQEMRDRQREREEAYLTKGSNQILDSTDEIRVSNESVGDLLEQMKRSVSGQKDLHDIIVEDFERRSKENFLRLQAEKERQRKEAKAYREMFPVPENENVAVYDEKDMEREIAIQKQRKREALRSGLYSDQQNYEDAQHHLKKWGVLDNE